MMILSLKPKIISLLIISSIVIIFITSIIIRGFLFAKKVVIRCSKCKNTQSPSFLYPNKHLNHLVKGKCIHCNGTHWFTIEIKH